MAVSASKMADDSSARAFDECRNRVEMADLLRSAFGYFASGSGDAAGQHEMVGRTVQLSNDNKLTIKKVLAEGKPSHPRLNWVIIF